MNQWKENALPKQILFNQTLTKLTFECNNHLLECIHHQRQGEKNFMSMKKEKQLKKLEKLTEVMQNMVDGEFTGHVKINFTQGGIGRIEKFEEILREDDR